LKLVLTCEHAGNHIPDKFKVLFINGRNILKTHRGYDPGAFDLFAHIKELADYNRHQNESRLLIEVNRSLHHPSLFWKLTRNLPKDIRKELIENYYLPYRTDVINAIGGFIEKGEEVIHLSIHSFTPELNGNKRNADIGLLYDPSRQEEKRFCMALKSELLNRDSSLKIRFNYPYRGTADGFTTSLRKIYPENYRGIEIEVNQKFVKSNKMDPGININFFSSLEALIRN